MQHLDVTDVAVDSDDNVYLLTRFDSRILVYDRDGNWRSEWASGILSERPHGLTIAPDDTVYCVDEGNQVVLRFTREGEQIAQIGVKGRLSDTGVDWSIKGSRARLATMTRSGPPFNHPTKLAVSPSGDLYVSDGYGNARVHRFSPVGELIASWGEPGSGPGQFRVPHSVAITADERVLVADRENDRVQVFTLEGEFLDEWTNLQRPAALATGPNETVFVAEMPRQPGDFSGRLGEISFSSPGRIAVLNSKGTLLERFGTGPDPCQAGVVAVPHGLAVDSHGDLYVAEVTFTFLIKQQLAPSGCHSFQKFVCV
jgi:DNA-binding beta-propeller fold protein YncE